MAAGNTTVVVGIVAVGIVLIGMAVVGMFVIGIDFVADSFVTDNPAGNATVVGIDCNLLCVVGQLGSCCQVGIEIVGC